MFFGVPTMYVRLPRKAGERDPAADSPVRFGSARPYRPKRRAFEDRFGARILERYGATESGSSRQPLARSVLRGTVGIPMPGVRVRIAAPDGLGTAAGRRRSANFGRRRERVRGILKDRRTLPNRSPWMTTERAGIRSGDSRTTSRRLRLPHRRAHQGTDHHRRLQRLPARSRRRTRTVRRRARLRGRRQARPGARRTPDRVRRN